MANKLTKAFEGGFTSLVQQRAYSGANGSNRSPSIPKIHGEDGTPVNDDAQAVACWLQRVANEHTRRTYRKEIERFMLWSILEQRKPLSSIAVNDVLLYRTFLSAPPLAWIGPRRPRGPEWKPFEKALSPSSIRQAMVILGDCFNWLTKVRYLDFNVFEEKLVRVRQTREDIKTERHIPERALTWFLSWVSSLPEGNVYARWRFGARLLTATGLREAELASAKMGDIITHSPTDGPPMHFLRVLGKGSKVRNVPLVDLSIITDYREEMSLPALPYAGDQMPLWIPGKGKTNVTPGAIYKDIKTLFRTASVALQEEASREPDERIKAEMMIDAQIIAAASPHWLRHSFGGEKAKKIPIQVVQLILGHSSITTTQVYVKTEIEDAYRSLANAG